MTLEDIKRIIQAGESYTLELKKSTAQLRGAFETACAFLNADGGIVLFGITDDLRIKGQEIADKTKREIGSELSKITPKPNIEIFYIPVDSEKYVIALHATTDSTKKPYLYDGRAFIRLQSETWPMPREYLQQLMMNNADANHQWETQAQEKATLDNLDTDEILATLNEGIRNGRIPESYSTTDPWVILQRFGLIVDNKITNAAIILFGKHPELKFPQCLLRMARFRGTDKAEFIDQKQVTGNAFKLLREAMAFAMTYLPISSTFPRDSFQRKDTPLFPIPVLREAIANAICHRDYSYGGGSIGFAIYDDRIEIWNYGLLPLGVTIESLKTLKQSLPRNRLIANVFYYHRIFESWGRGVHMIVDECKKSGHPEPFYSQEAGGTQLTLPSYQMIGNTAVQMRKTTAELLTVRQAKIMALLKEHEALSTEELRVLIPSPPSERTLRNELTHLKDLGLIDAVGKTTARKWYVTL